MFTDTRTGNQYSYDTSHIKGNKREPLEQRLVLGETSSDAPVVRNAVRTRDDRPFYEDKVKRAGKESLSGRSEKSRKKPSHDGRDRRRIELVNVYIICLLYTSPSPRDRTRSRMPSSA